MSSTHRSITCVRCILRTYTTYYIQHSICCLCVCALRRCLSRGYVHTTVAAEFPTYFPPVLIVLNIVLHNQRHINCTADIANSVELRTTREATSWTATQELRCISCNPKVHYSFTRVLHWARPVQLASSHPISVWIFVTILFFTVKRSPTPNPQFSGPPLFSCPRLLIHCIRSCLPSATWGLSMLWWQETHLTRTAAWSNRILL
jgi:hypothetical protein